MSTAFANQASIDALTGISIQDLVESIGFDGIGLGRRVVESLVRGPAERFARQIAEFDRRVGVDGLSGASRWLLARNARGLEVSGRESILDGPLLVVANHPGLADAVSLFIALNRPDIMIVAADRPFLRALANVRRHLIFLRGEPRRQIAQLRAMGAHLRGGGALLLFPGGDIEPDPALSGDAIPALDRWSNSIGVLPRLCPECRIVPAVVSGVVSPAAAANPITRLRRSARDRDRLAAALQIVASRYRQVTIRVSFGEPLQSGSTLGLDAASVSAMIIDRVRELMRNPPTGWQRLV